MIEDDRLAAFKAQRYAGWDGELGRRILDGGYTLQGLADEAAKHDFRPAHVSGQQEWLENLVNRYIYG